MCVFWCLLIGDLVVEGKGGGGVQIFCSSYKFLVWKKIWLGKWVYKCWSLALHSMTGNICRVPRCDGVEKIKNKTIVEDCWAFNLLCHPLLMEISNLSILSVSLSFLILTRPDRSHQEKYDIPTTDGSNQDLWERSTVLALPSVFYC